MRYEDSCIFDSRYSNRYPGLVEEFQLNPYNVSPGDIEGRTVVDIGANVGIFSIMALSFGASEVICYEPNPSNHNELKNNLKAHPEFDNKWRIFCRAVTGTGQDIELVDGWPGSTVGRVGYTESGMTSVSINEVLAFLSAKRDAILKMDCEGSEYDIFNNVTDWDLFKSIFSFIHIEIHETVIGNPVATKEQHIELVKLLESKGYQIEDEFNVAWGAEYKFKLSSTPKRNKFKLAIMITAHESNNSNRQLLENILKTQIDSLGGAYYIIDYDPNLSIGAKRQRMLDSVDNAEYVVYLDDDDLVGFDYLAEIYNAMETSPDCIAIQSFKSHGSYYGDINFKPQRFTLTDGEHHISLPINHWCPRKTDIAKLTRWMDLSHREDLLWSAMQLNYIYEIAYINKPVHLYIKRDNSAADVLANKNLQRDPILWNMFLELGICEPNCNPSNDLVQNIIDDYRSNVDEGGWYTPEMVAKWRPIVDKESNQRNTIKG